MDSSFGSVASRPTSEEWNERHDRLIDDLRSELTGPLVPNVIAHDLTYGGPDYSQLGPSERRYVWDQFSANYDHIAEELFKNRRGEITWPSRVSSLFRFAVTVLRVSWDNYDWRTEIGVYNMGVRSLELYREVGVQRWKGTPIRHSQQVGQFAYLPWNLYDHGGSTVQTMDFYLWTTKRLDWRPTDRWIFGVCK